MKARAFTAAEIVGSFVCGKIRTLIVKQKEKYPVLLLSCDE